MYECFLKGFHKTCVLIQILIKIFIIFKDLSFIGKISGNLRFVSSVKTNFEYITNHYPTRPHLAFQSLEINTSTNRFYETDNYQ